MKGPHMFKGIIVQHKATGKIWIQPSGPVGNPKWTDILVHSGYNAVTTSPVKWEIGGNYWKSEKEIHDEGWLPMIFAANNGHKREIYKVIRSQFRDRREKDQRKFRWWNSRNGGHHTLALLDDREIWAFIDELEFVEINFIPDNTKPVDFFAECAPKKISKF